MRRSTWLHELRASLGHSKNRRARNAKWRPTAARRPKFESLEERDLLAVLTVNSALDNNTPSDGLVTLREAIIASNNNTTTDLGQMGSGADTIQFAPSVNSTISLVFGEFVITQSLTISGPGRDVLTIDAHENSRIFNFTAQTGDFTISDLALTRGRVVSNTTLGGGAINKDGTGLLKLERISITASTAVYTGSFNFARGGAVFVGGGTLSVISSLLSGNQALGTAAKGGAIAAGGRIVNVIDSTIANNQAIGMQSGQGGGIYVRYYSPNNVPAELTLTGTTISGNTAESAGGGVFVNRGVIVDGTVTGNRTTSGGILGDGGGGIYSNGGLVLQRVTIHGNSTATTGGGVKSAGGGTVESSTVSGNTSGAGGGGFYCRTGGFVLSNSTITGNMSRVEGGGVMSAFGYIKLRHSTITSNSSLSGGGVLATQGEVRAFSTIIAGNTATTNPDLFSGDNRFVLDYTIIGNAAGTNLTESQTPDARGNRIGKSTGGGIIDPRLAPLADNGGPTQTHALLFDSPAIDANLFQPTPAPVRDYQLNGSLADALGGPPLMALGGFQQAERYAFSANQGLNATMALANPAQYSLEILFDWYQISGGWQKIIDFHNLTSNVGLYTAGNGLQFVNGPFTANLFSSFNPVRLVLTRDDATDVARAYVNGNEVWNFIDSAGDAVFDGPNQIIRFFQDDTVTGQTEAEAGRVDFIRIYNAVLTKSQIDALPNPIVVSQFDQRGLPRVRDGDGVGGAQIDMGAFESQSVVLPLPMDYGDAPDTVASTGPGNYNTLASDNGPQHTIVPGLRIGFTVDSDSGSLQNGAASADDMNGALPDDEDGLSNPAADLVLTVGAQPTVNVRVTNTTGSAATLYGWIDYNANGVFDNATERASVAVPNGTNNSVVTLTFPAVPTGFTGTTYARFRLSTDSAAANATGPASDGEVEDYGVSISLPGTATADSEKNTKIANAQNGGPALADGDKFGSAVTAIGDLDGDGIGDMAVGAPSRFGEPSPGNGYILFMNANGTVKARQRIASGVGGGPSLSNGDYFGHSVATLGDLNGDGVTDLAVGASKDDTGGYINGAVYVLFMNTNGTVKNSQKIAHNFGGGPSLATSDRFGSAVSAIGDLDGDGVTDLAVGASGDDTGGTYRGAVHVLLLNPNGTVKASQKIAHGVGGGPALLNLDFFGGALANVGDLDGDGHTELAVGASGDDTSGSGRGAVYVLFLNANGTVKNIRKIASGTNGGPALSDDDAFGRAVASIGDLDGDGVTDLAVGAYRDDTGGGGRGAVHVLLLNSDGTVKSSQKIASGVGGGPTLANDDRFGSAIASLGDLDGDGRIDLAVGAETDDTSGDSRGAVHVLFLTAANTAPVFTSPDSKSVPENTTSVLTVMAIDANAPPQTVTFSIVGGVDQSKFSITSGGALSFVTPPNFEVPTDANGDNVYIVIVQASDGSLGTLQAIVVTVTPVNDNIPVFVSPSAVTVSENTTTVVNLLATDADIPPQSISYSIASGVDQSKFNINGNVLQFNAPPNWEVPTDANGDNVYQVVVSAYDGNGSINYQVILVTVAALRDSGDAPDATVGTGAGNYNTRLADSGPRHMIVSGLRLGATVDGDDGFLQNAAANADDVNGALPDDEDGVSNPLADLSLTIGPQPTVNMRVTNTTGTVATLYGWIDYNSNGIFDNATERASAVVASGTNNDIVILVFPEVPAGYFGKTYARFRLSTDAAASNPIGPATDGEVEDYPATIIKPSDLTADSSKTKLLSSNMNGVPVLGSRHMFGAAVASIGDLDGDGVTDLAVGDPGDVSGSPGGFGEYRGAVYVLFMHPNGTVRTSQKIANDLGGGPPLLDRSRFGKSVAAIGDLNGDGTTDLAVGAYRLNSQDFAGGVYVLFMNADGTVKSRQAISSGIGGGPILGNNDRFGRSVTSLGDVDGDGVSDIAVGATGDGGQYRGAVHILFMKVDGTVKGSKKTGNGNTGDFFGTSAAGLGDIDGDGVPDLAVGALTDDSIVENSGAVHLLFLNQNGTVKSRQEIGNGIGGGPILSNDRFGSSVASLGDIDGNGVTDLAVGATQDDTPTPESDRGAVHILLLNADGTVTRSQKIASGTGGGPFLRSRHFGQAVASFGDLDGDGLVDLAVSTTDSIEPVYLLFLESLDNNPVFTSPNTASVPENTTAVMTVTATDDDVPPGMLTYSIVFGTDQSKFSITPGGALSFVTLPNFEAPTDANADNVYVVIVQAEDGSGGTAIQTINVTVTPVNEHAPVFTLPDVVNVPENNNAVINLTATDADLPPQVVTFSIAGGADQSKLSVTPGGVLSFNVPPNFEAPTDANGDNVYVVIVQASDGSLTNLHALLVTVTNVNEVPVDLVGDYNMSGMVDAADYVVWRNALGSSIVLPNDTTPGTVTQTDYNVWRANFGRSAAGSAASTVEVVTEADGRNEAAFVVPALAGFDRLNAEIRTRDLRPAGFRSARRDAVVIPSLHDRALQAWLTSRPTVRWSDPDALRYDMHPHDRENQERSETVHALDMAFAVF